MVRKIYKSNKDPINYFIVVIIQSGLQIAIIPFITSILSTEEYSDLSLANNIFGILVVVTHFGFINTYSVRFYKEKSVQKLTYNMLIAYGLNVSVMCTGIILIYMTFNIQLLDFNFVLLILLATLMEVYFELFRTKLRLEFLSFKYLVAMVLKLVGFNALFIFLMYQYGLDGRAKFIGLFLVVLVIIIPILTKFKNQISLIEFDRKLIKKIYKSSSAIAPGQIAKTIQNTFDIFVVFYLIGKTEFALFAIAIQLSRPLERFSASLLDAFVPKLYKSLSEDSDPSAEDKKNHLKYILLVGLAAATAILLGPLLFELLVSNEYLRQAVLIFPFLVAGRYIFSIAQYHESLIIYHGKYRFSSLVNLINVLSMLILFYLLFKNFDLIGIGYAYVLIKFFHYIFIVSGYLIFKIKYKITVDHMSVILIMVFAYLYHL